MCQLSPAAVMIGVSVSAVAVMFDVSVVVRYSHLNGLIVVIYCCHD